MRISGPVLLMSFVPFFFFVGGVEEELGDTPSGAQSLLLTLSLETTLASA